MSKRANVLNLKLNLIILLYLILAISYSVVVPIGRGADEWAHYWYAQFIAKNGRLPLDSAEREAAGYKSDWPPLYHLAAAAVTGWIDTDGPPSFKYREDNIRRHLVPAQGPEAILHTEDERFPWQQEILAWHLGRFLSILFSSGTLVVTYFIALELFEGGKWQVAGGRWQGEGGAGSKVAEEHASHLTPHAPRFAQDVLSPQTLALITVTMLAFNPRFLFTGMLFNYDSLTLLLVSVFLWMAFRVAREGYVRWGFWVLGALAGLAVVTKYLTILLPVVIIFVVWVRVAGAQGRQGAEVQGGRGAGSRSAAAHHSQFTVHNLQFTIRYLAQAAVAYLLVSGWWFVYLITNFNEVDKYGPLLGTLAPLIRGDASDRTVETLFAWLSRGQAPPPAFIERQSYTAWQIIASFWQTFWGNPVIKPYPLNWFILVMVVASLLSIIGLVSYLRFTFRSLRLSFPQFILHHSALILLILACLLPVPFMLVRLFGARDALEAVQGRHILFLAGPAVVILMVWGLAEVVAGGRWQVAGGRSRVAGGRLSVSRFTFYLFIGFLLTGAVGQLIFMTGAAYRPLLPVRTTPYVGQTSLPFEIELPGGAKLVDYQVKSLSSALEVKMIWQAGNHPAPEDYQTELALVDSQEQTHSSWRAYQTQAHYPTRAWEPGDIVRDEGWLPLAGLPPGDYEVRLRILGEDGPVADWRTLDTHCAEHMVRAGTGWLLWQQGQTTRRPLLLRERETAQLTFETGTAQPELIGPDGVARYPISAGANWVNFIIGPEWPAGAYHISEADVPLLRVAQSKRSFQIPDIPDPLSINFAGKIKLLGYELPSRRVEPGSGLPVTLYWQGLAWMDEEFVIFDRLLDNRQVAWGGYDRLAKENYSTLLWAPGEIIIDGFAVPVDPDAPDGVYRLSVGWYGEVEGQALSLPILDPETGEPTGQTAVAIGPIKVGGPPAGVTVAQAAPQYEINATLGEKIKLLGFSAKHDALSLALTFFWQTLAPPQQDYTVFVHVRNSADDVVAQKDSPPVGGVYPTGLWDTGEIIRDQVIVPLESLEPGVYEVVVGMYDFETGERLTADNSPDGAIRLWSFELSE